jgi:hypothetical protein
VDGDGELILTGHRDGDNAAERRIGAEQLLRARGVVPRSAECLWILDGEPVRDLDADRRRHAVDDGEDVALDLLACRRLVGGWLASAGLERLAVGAIFSLGSPIALDR